MIYYAIEDKKGKLVKYEGDPTPILERTKKNAEFRVSVIGYGKPVKVRIERVEEKK